MAWFDATQHDPIGAGGLPVGVHPAVITGSTKVATKDNTGGMLRFTLSIIDGPNKGQTGQYNLNLWNANAQSAEIAQRQLSALCHVIGVYQLNAMPEGAELFNKPFRIVVEQQAPPNDKYTQVTAVQDSAGNPPVKGQAPTQAAPQQQQQPTFQQPAQQPMQPAQQPQFQPQAPQSAPAQAQPQQQWNQGGQQQAPAQAQPQAWAQQPPAGGGGQQQPNWNR